MKRPIDEGPIEEKKMKKIKGDEDEGGEEEEKKTGFSDLDEDLLFEVLKHVDARTLGAAACVSRMWCKAAQDERLWEMICTRQSASIGCGNQQLRSVVLALEGFRRLHSLYLWPLLKPPPAPSSSSSSASSSSSSSSSASVSVPSLSPFPTGPIQSMNPNRHWGKDELHLSISLLSIRYYEKMNPNKRGR